MSQIRAKTGVSYQKFTGERDAGVSWAIYGWEIGRDGLYGSVCQTICKNPLLREK